MAVALLCFELERERDFQSKSGFYNDEQRAQCALGAMAKTRLMFVNEAEPGLGRARLCAPSYF